MVTCLSLVGDGQTGSNPPRTRRTQRPGKGLIASAVEKANSQSTTQPTRTSVFYDFRVFWQPPAVLYVVVQPNHATLWRQRPFFNAGTRRIDTPIHIFLSGYVRKRLRPPNY